MWGHIYKCDVGGVTRLEIIMLQIFAIILFSNSLILLLLFSQFSAIILIILRLKELSFVILQHERTFHILAWPKLSMALSPRGGQGRAGPLIWVCRTCHQLLAFTLATIIILKIIPA